MRIVLASASPRRKELFHELFPEFEVVESGVEEKNIEEKDPLVFALKAAEEKARKVGERYPEAIVFGFDTVVTIDGEIFGKPGSLEEAKTILKKLSNREHKVITAVAIYRKDENRLLTGYEISFVRFKELSDEEIEKYLATESHWDKAGAYGIQEIGEEFVVRLKGDYQNVVGLPVARVRKLWKKFNAPEVLLEIVDYALPNDYGVGRSENMVVFVPKAVLGEKLKVRILKKTRNYAFAERIAVKSLSLYRVEPKCLYFERCGGCAFQNLVYEKQLEVKEKYLRATLEKIGEINLEKVRWNRICPSPKIFHYRNKMEFAFGEEKGRVVIGLRERSYPYQAPYRKKVIGIENCEIFSPVLNRIIFVIQRFANDQSLSAYDPFTKKGFLRHLVVREGKNSGEIMIILVTKKGNLELEGLAKTLTTEIPQLKSLYWATNEQISDVVRLEEKKHVYGEESTKEKVGDLKLKIYPETFLQPNTFAAEMLYQKISEYVSTNDRVLGLYCGMGAIELSLAEKVKEVVGVDSETINIYGARENCEINNIRNATFYCASIEKVETQRFKGFDFLVVDPPRGGVSKKALTKIVRISVPKILYVSCNPATLARDLKELSSFGYKLKEVSSFDFFPHTAHLETLCYLEKE